MENRSPQSGASETAIIIIGVRVYGRSVGKNGLGKAVAGRHEDGQNRANLYSNPIAAFVQAVAGLFTAGD